jgi:hypothetical protein
MPAFFKHVRSAVARAPNWPRDPVGEVDDALEVAALLVLAVLLELDVLFELPPHAVSRSPASSTVSSAAAAALTLPARLRLLLWC